MKSKWITIISCIMLASTEAAFAGGKTGACTPPTCTISISPDQKCGGTQTVAIGKALTLTANDLKDKDCYCGNAVQDTINSSTGVQWSVGGTMGTFTGGDKGTPKTWTAPADTHTSLVIRVKLDDDATAPNTTDDGSFLEVTDQAKNLDVVKPNKGSTSSTGVQACPSPVQTGTHGHWQYWHTGVARDGCTVDFDGLKVNEKGCAADSNGCNVTFLTGTNNPAQDETLSGNNADYDLTGPCSTTNSAPAADCTTTSHCDWSIIATGGSYIDWGRFNYTFFWPHTGGYDSETTSRAWGSAL